MSSTPFRTDELAARGYELRHAPVSVQLAALDDVVARTRGDADVDETLADTWLELWAGTRGFSHLEAARGILTNGVTAFARLGEVVGRGVAVGEWLGITTMATLPEARRRGHARAIVHALARWGKRQSCTRAIVQVDSTNDAALTLYAQAGFAPHHEYQYRILR